MKLQQLHMLIALADTGSLQEAAERLHRTQSALSMGLRKLEETVGFSLFERGGYRLGLTAQGEQFLRQAQEVVKQQQRLQSLTQQLQTGAEAQLTIGYDYTCDPTMLVEPIRVLQQQFPATELLLHGDSQMRVLRYVREGKADLVISPWLSIFRQQGDFETKAIAPFVLTIVMATQLAENGGGMPTTRNQLLELPMLLPQNQDTGINLDAIMRMPAQQRIRVSDPRTQKAYLLAGLGWGIVPQHMVQTEIDDGLLVELHIPGLVTTTQLEIHAVRAADRIAGPAAAQLWQQL